LPSVPHRGLYGRDAQAEEHRRQQCHRKKPTSLQKPQHALSLSRADDNDCDLMHSMSPLFLTPTVLGTERLFAVSSVTIFVDHPAYLAQRLRSCLTHFSFDQAKQKKDNGMASMPPRVAKARSAASPLRRSFRSAAAWGRAGSCAGTEGDALPRRREPVLAPWRVRDQPAGGTRVQLPVGVYVE
jgi:hypothetical protein